MTTRYWFVVGATAKAIVTVSAVEWVASANTSAYVELSYTVIATSRVLKLWVSTKLVAALFPTEAANLRATTVVSIAMVSELTVIPVPAPTLRVLPLFVRPSPATIWPRPVNCVKTSSVVPMVTAPSVVVRSQNLR